MCVFYKRLDSGTFKLPAAVDERTKAVAIDERTLEALLDGIDVEQKAATERRRRSVH